MTAPLIYLTDKQIASRLGLSPNKWESIAPVLEREGAPRRDALFDDKRCWPALLEFLVKRAGGSAVNTALPVENGGSYHGFKSKARRANTNNKAVRPSGVILALQQNSESSGI